MDRPNEGGSGAGHYALVSYIPEPLLTFLDTVCRDLAPESNPHAHVTILPPRPCIEGVTEALQLIGSRIGQFAPFEVEIGGIEIFTASNVVYLALKAGSPRLHALYAAFNRDCLEYREIFPYHPHITLAQDLTPEEAVKAAESAQLRWDAWTGPRSFHVHELSLVRNTGPLKWADIAAIALARDPNSAGA